MASALFRFMAALGRDIVVANTFGTFSLLAVTVLGGFVISRGKWNCNVTLKLTNLINFSNDKSVLLH